jgi:hypothetical protein
METEEFNTIKEGAKGRVYREYKGIRYWLWRKRGLWCSQKNGKQSFLHRVLWVDRVGGVPAGYEIVPLGEWDNFSADNWKARIRCSGHKVPSKHPFQEFAGKKFYRTETGYYHNKHHSKLLHRFVWEFYNGEIPKGFEIHHLDCDKSNNGITNLALITRSEHAKLHAKDNKWIGSEKNKRQLRKECKKLGRLRRGKSREDGREAVRLQYHG